MDGSRTEQSRRRGGLVRVLGLLALAGGSAALGQGRDEGDGIKPVPDRMLEVAVEPGRGTGATYEIGERIALRVRATEDCYLTVYDITPSGRVQVIFPHAYDADNRLDGGAWRSIPDRDDRWHYEVGGPPGWEYVVAVATRKAHRPPPYLSETRLDPPAAGADREEALEHWRKAAEDLNARIVPVPDGPGPHPDVAFGTSWLLVRPPRPPRPADR